MLEDNGLTPRILVAVRGSFVTLDFISNQTIIQIIFIKAKV
jgi:stringent starvation protein B